MRDKLPDKIMDGVYVINLDEYADIGTHWIALYSMKLHPLELHSNGNTITYFDSFRVEHIPKGIKSSSKVLKSQQIFLEYKYKIQ